MILLPVFRITVILLAIIGSAVTLAVGIVAIEIWLAHRAWKRTQRDEIAKMERILDRAVTAWVRSGH